MILQGDALSVLSTLPGSSVSSCVTSPPYWRKRAYGTVPVAWPEARFTPACGLPEFTVPPETCELGHEADLWGYVAHQVLVFREVRRLIGPTGVLMLNLGDTYGPDKGLLGVPWKVAAALQADGWLLRMDLIWNKSACQPESVTDRCTTSHETVFHFAAGDGYYWDQAALAEPLSASSEARLRQNIAGQTGSAVPGKQGPMKACAGSSKLSVQAWADLPDRSSRMDAGQTARTKTGDAAPAHQRRDTSAHRRTQDGERQQYRRAIEKADAAGLTDAHLLALKAVGLSGSGRGALQSGHGHNDPEVQRLADEAKAALGSYAREFLGGTLRNRRSVWTFGPGKSQDGHTAVMNQGLARDLVVACTPPGGTVLDPFAGSGTTGRAALELGREFVGIELHPGNVTLAQRTLRRSQPGLGLTGSAAGVP